MAPNTGHNGGFDPFRDSHGRWASAQSAGLAGIQKQAKVAASRSATPRNALHGPPPGAKSEWERDGIRIVTITGRAPRYEVYDGESLVHSVRATRNWQQELAELKGWAADYHQERKASLQRGQANVTVRELASAQKPASGPPTGYEDAPPELWEVARMAAEIKRGSISPDGVIAVGKALAAAIPPEDKFAVEDAARRVAAAQKKAWAAEAHDVAAALGELALVEIGAASVMRESHIAALHALRPTAEASDLQLDRKGPGGTEMPFSDQMRWVKEAAAMLPKAWVLAGNRKKVKVAESSDRRASYNPGIFDGGGPTIRLDSWKDSATALHELGHHMEYHVPGLATAAVAFLKARCGDEKPQRLRSLVGGGNYRDDEVAVRDSFAHPYFGKIYNDGATELVSMGLEGVYFNKHNLINGDPDLYYWMLGALATYGT